MKYNRFMLFIAIIISLLFHLECENAIIDKGHFYIDGFVNDSTTGVPIDSAWIDIDDTTSIHYTYTDSTGYYYFGFLGGSKPVEFPLFCGKEGYYTWDSILYIPAGHGFIDTVDIELVPK